MYGSLSCMLLIELRCVDVQIIIVVRNDEEAKQLYVGTWVTQVALAHPDGNGIRHYRNKQECLLMCLIYGAHVPVNTYLLGKHALFMVYIFP